MSKLRQIILLIAELCSALEKRDATGIDEVGARYESEIRKMIAELNSDEWRTRAHLERTLAFILVLSEMPEPAFDPPIPINQVRTGADATPNMED